ncbi:NAD(P)H-binding protein [Domibacillus robiginosus]|uniref:NAD(P)H-binding protein n=1 Tax=Domibacillus robiginosus TaxID=1071054 RepID=UPI00067C282F|nr:NAD(P)H-binding protein [Domibacillus robiginosus]
MKKRAQIAVIGGTGKVGQHIADQAMQHGYHVRVLVRDPQKLRYQNSKMEVLQGSVENDDILKALLQDCQTVVNAFGQPPKDSPLYSHVTKKVLDVMNELQITRYIGVTGASLTLKNDKKSLINRTGSKLFKAVYADMLEDKQREADLLLRCRDVNWTLIRLPFVKERVNTADVKVDIENTPGLTIGNKDIARFIISQIEGKQYIHQTPFIAN